MKQHPLVPEGQFRISPSMIEQFTTKKHEWYRSQVLGEETFSGNTSTFLGQCIHLCAEHIVKKGEIDYTEIEEFIRQINNIEVDKAYILNQLVPLSQTITRYISTTNINQSEVQVAEKLMEGIYVAGTIDAITKDNVIIDFKTTDTLAPKDYIPQGYKWQLLTYAWILRQQDILVNTIRLVWITHHHINRISDKTGKAMKDYPSTYKVINYEITGEDMNFIDNYLRLIGESVLKCKSNPELTYLIMSDYRLKEKDEF